MKKQMAFYEIGGGVFAQEAQAMFEECQQVALVNRQPIVITMKIAITPPKEGDNFGRTQFSLNHTMPTKKSIEFTTLYEAGVAMADGASVEAITQMALNLTAKGGK
jgi:hypothetical protein